MNERERRAQLVKEAQAVAEKAQAEGRDILTTDERQQIETRMTEIKSLNEILASEARSKNILGQLDAMAAGSSMPQPGGGGELAPSLGALEPGKMLSFSAKMAEVAAAKVMPAGQKALATSGSILVGQEFSPSPITMEKPANSLLAALPVQQHSTPSWKYLRQSVRTNNAAVVADGATKPTSVYSVVEVENSLAVIAHLSEGVPRYWFVDNSSMQQFLSNELAYGLGLAVEAKALADINATVGVQTQAYSNSVLETLRKSVTKVEVLGYVPAWFLLHPTDWEALELMLLTQEAIDYRSLPFDPVARRLFGVPVIVSTAQAVGVSHTVAKGVVELDTDTSGVLLQWSETSNADDFAKNLVRARMEGRFATTVYSPLGVVKGDLTA
ncbi:phage major capsid protein [Mycolicibacterium fortuitum]|uniref:phage major capsid protein n=1 Tax=Mycolicibacterium fortuitum TaxID=1766 RepID=UPI00241D26AC|nr:phage major capsid protein [Mycolicibacterium fortuitum]MDG5772368.1 phage major capsid protein [Mycolicibacterium fortuitum]MDG5782631.1 phage major capsid protein [Mycolicibacterium fortuitum]